MELETLYSAGRKGLVELETTLCREEGVGGTGDSTLCREEGLGELETLYSAGRRD